MQTSEAKIAELTATYQVFAQKIAPIATFGFERNQLGNQINVIYDDRREFKDDIGEQIVDIKDGNIIWVWNTTKLYVPETDL